MNSSDRYILQRWNDYTRNMRAMHGSDFSNMDVRYEDFLTWLYQHELEEGTYDETNE